SPPPAGGGDPRTAGSRRRANRRHRRGDLPGARPPAPRLGGRDFGSNADRIRAYLDDVANLALAVK
ncbi:hypothetical protein OMR07_07780, partial [Methylobacterium organophilum]|nr:hypothetical protein [Methylobacterium organophilum]